MVYFKFIEITGKLYFGHAILLSHEVLTYQQRSVHMILRLNEGFANFNACLRLQTHLLGGKHRLAQVDL